MFSPFLSHPQYLCNVTQCVNMHTYMHACILTCTKLQRSFW